MESLCEEATAERPSGKAGEDTDAAMEDADTAREDTAREDADTAPPLYHIKRAVYSEDLLQSQLLHCRHRRPVSLPQKLAQTFRCSSERAKAVALGCLPVLTWLPSYPVREYLFDDVVSGLSTGVVQLPQGLAYAMLAAVPAVYGLYSSFYPVFLYTFFGTSRHISIGTFAVMSLMIGGVVVREAPDAMFPLQAANGTNMSVTVDVDARDARRVQVAVALTTLVGLIQLLFGLLRFGFVAIYLTEPLVRGFTTAAAVHVFISQLKYLLGVKTRRFSGPLAAVYSFVAAMSDIANTNIVTLLVGLICMAFLYAVKDCNERFKKKLPVPIPGEIIVVIVSTASSYGLGLSDNYKVDVVGNIPSGLLPPAVPHFHLLPNLIADSFAIAIVGFSMAISMAKTFALKHGYNVDGNQELMALGLCNFVSSFFQTFAISCSMSRSLVQESTGGKTQIAGLLASLLVLLVVVAIGFMFQPLPQTVLAAIIMVNLLGMFKQTLDIPVLWRSSKIELAIWLVSFVASVLLGLDYGLMVALTFAILTVIYRTQSPRTTLLGQIPGTGLYCDMDQYEGAVDVSGIKIFQSNSSIYFANTDLYVNSLRDKTGVNPAKLQAEWKAKEKLKKENEVLCPPAESSCTGPEVTELLSWNQEAELKNGQATAPVPVHTIILDWTPVNFMDTVGAKAIKSVIKEYEAVDVRVLIAGCSRTLLSELETLQFFSTSVTPAMVFPTVHDAVLRSQHQRDLACSHQ